MIIKTTFLLFNGIEALDFVGPYSVLTLMRMDEAKRRESESPFQVRLCSLNGADSIRTTSGLEISTPDTISEGEGCDLLCVPGGFGVRHVLKAETAPEVIQRLAKSANVVASICTGSLLLAQAGLLNGLKATTHHKSLDLLRSIDPSIDVQEDQRVVANAGRAHHVLTSSGIAAGLDLGLSLVAHYFGDSHRANVAQHMEYLPG